ncbi:MAG: GtrA family protein [Parcubacteria group bacterium Gr01-1014_44]|nr:MAG: GtrA family protein [Parcubacteria group bacterium Gr01-1014_44]
MKFTKKDLWFSIVTGIGTGLIAWRIFNFLEIPRFQQISFVWLAGVVPIIWILGVNLGYFLGRWLKFFNQFGKFVAIGFTNATVDFGILNLLIFATGIATGAHYSIFKTASFLVALINSYLLNKYWAFGAGQTSPQGGEFFKFAGVAVIAALLNVGVASYIVNFVNPVFSFSTAVWANIGAAAGGASALVVSFTGFKLLVFKERVEF